MRLKINIILFLFLVCHSFIHAQETKESIEKKAELHFKNKEYFEATPLYLRLLSLEPRDHNYNYKYGTCLLFNSNEKKNAFKYLNYAIQAPESVELEAYFFLGKAFHLTFQFDKAIRYYQQYKELAGNKIRRDLEVDRQIAMCKNGKTLMSNLTDIVILKKTKMDAANFFRVYDLSNIGGQFLVTEEFQTKNDKRKNHIPLIHFPSNSQHVYYSSYGEKGEDKDIYVRTRLPDGNWSKPRALDNTINTPFNEEYPYMSPTRKYLYFCSEGHNSMGGYDIFRSEYDEDLNTFGPPENLDIPISSPDNDFLYVVDSLEQYAYFASQRTSETNKIDVYKVRVERAPTQFVILKGKFESNITPAEKLLSIHVKNNAGKSMGDFETDSNGEYLIHLPQGGRYEFILKVGDKAQTVSCFVDIPYLREFRPLKQKAYELIANDEEAIELVNLFDEKFEDEAAIMAEVLALKSKMNVNHQQFDLEELDQTQENAKKLEALGLHQYTSLEIQDLMHAKIEAIAQKERNSLALLEESKGGVERTISVIQYQLKKADSLFQKAEQNSDKELQKTQILLAHKAIAEAKQLKEEVMDQENLQKFIEKQLSANKEIVEEAATIQTELTQIDSEDASSFIAILLKYPEFSKTLQQSTSQDIAFEFQEFKDSQQKKENELQESKNNLSEEKKKVQATIQGLREDLANSSKRKAEQLQTEINKAEGALFDLDNELNYIEAQTQQLYAEVEQTMDETQVQLFNDIAQLDEKIKGIEAAEEKYSSDQKEQEMLQETTAESVKEPIAKQNEDDDEDDNDDDSRNQIKNESKELEVNAANTEHSEKETTTSQSITEESLTGNYKIVDAINPFDIEFYELLTPNEKIESLAKLKKETTNQLIQEKAENSKSTLHKKLLAIEKEIIVQKNEVLHTKINNELPTLAEFPRDGNQTVHSLSTYAEQIALRQSIDSLLVQNPYEEATINNINLQFKQVEKAVETNRKITEVSDYIDKILANETLDKITSKSIRTIEQIQKEQKAIELKLQTLRNRYSFLLNKQEEISEQDVLEKTQHEKRQINILIEELEFLYSENNAAILALEQETAQQSASRIQSNTQQKATSPSEEEIASKELYHTLYQNEQHILTKNKEREAAHQTLALQKKTLDEIRESTLEAFSDSDQQLIKEQVEKILLTKQSIQQLSNEIQQLNTTNETLLNASEAKEREAMVTLLEKNTLPSTGLHAEQEKSLVTDSNSVGNSNKQPDNTAIEKEEPAAPKENEVVENKQDQLATQDNTSEDLATQPTLLDEENPQEKEEATTVRTALDHINTVEQSVDDLLEQKLKSEQQKLTDFLSEKEALESKEKNKPKLAKNKKHQQEILAVNQTILETEKQVIEAIISEHEALPFTDDAAVTKTQHSLIKVEELEQKLAQEKNMANKRAISEDLLETQGEILQNLSQAAQNQQWIQAIETSIERAKLQNISTLDIVDNKVQLQLEQEKNQVAIFHLLDELKEKEQDLSTAKGKDKARIATQINQRKELIEVLESANNTIAQKLQAIDKQAKKDKDMGISSQALEQEISYQEEVTITLSESYKQLFKTTNQLLQKQSDLSNKQEALLKEKERILQINQQSEQAPSENIAQLYSHLQKADALQGEVQTLKKEVSDLQDQINKTLENTPSERAKLENLLARSVAPLQKAVTIQAIETGISLSTAESNYSDKKPIPIEKESIGGLVFRVQIGAFSKPVPNATFKEFQPVSGDPVRPGLIRYVAGLFNSRNSAEHARDQIRKMGYHDAFVVAYCDGERIPVWRAVQLIESGSCIPEIEVKEDELFAKAESTTVTTQDKSQHGQLDQYAYNKAPNAAPAEAAEAKMGLYYTVQVGVYNRPVSAEQLHNISPLVTKRLPNGQIRYSSGIFNSISEAQPKRADAVQRGIKDAFITAYYQGNRITVTEAASLLKTYGDTILERNNPTQRSGNKIVNKSTENIQQEVRSPFLDGKDLQVQLISKSRYNSYPIQVLNRLNQDELIFYYDHESGTIKSFLFATNNVKLNQYQADFETEEYFEYIYKVHNKTSTKKSEALTQTDYERIHLSIEIEAFDLNSLLLEVIANNSFNKNIEIKDNKLLVNIYALKTNANEVAINELKALLSKLGATVLAKS